jgi:hypothetical protein
MNGSGMLLASAVIPPLTRLGQRRRRERACCPLWQVFSRLTCNEFNLERRQLRHKQGNPLLDRRPIVTDVDRVGPILTD